MIYARTAYIFVVSLLMYLGITLLGWGLTHLGEFFASAPRAVYALGVVAFALALAVQSTRSLEGIADGPGQKDKFVSRQHWVGMALVLTLLVGLFAIPYTSRRAIVVFPSSPLLAWAGMALSWLGYALIFWSGLALGKQYSAEVTIQQDHQLITAGPYRWVRHPRYLGILCLTLGISLVFHTWIGLIAFPFVAGLISWRIYDEEKLMRQEFGESWNAYCCRSWRLVPYLY